MKAKNDEMAVQPDETLRITSELVKFAEILEMMREQDSLSIRKQQAVFNINPKSLDTLRSETSTPRGPVRLST